MSKNFKFFCTSLCAYSISFLHADAPMMDEALPDFPTAQVVQLPIEEATPINSIPVIAAPVVAEPALPEPVQPAPKKVAQKVPELKVNPFTGKIKGRKVRMRLRADLDSRIIKELPKNELVTIVGEKGDFWAVVPPTDTKAYIFRSFVLDNVVEGTKVNVRLEPSLDAPVIAHMNTGDKVENPLISPINSKWLEIAPPADTHFYIAKELVEYAGGPEVKTQMDMRASTVEQLLDAAALLSKTELRKPFDDVDFDRVVKGFHTVIDDYSEFPEHVEQAKEALASFQEAYLHKRISYLEAKPEERLAVRAQSELMEQISEVTDKMKLWEPIEEALFASWTNMNSEKSKQEFYDDQRLAAVEIEGTVEPYNALVKNKPGDFVLRDSDSPIAFVYSTQVNLQNLVGKSVKLVAAPRPNNNFAFPAYFVLAVE